MAWSERRVSLSLSVSTDGHRLISALSGSKKIDLTFELCVLESCLKIVHDLTKFINVH